jgi:Zn-dependent alcohol dehydrogenase
VPVIFPARFLHVGAHEGADIVDKVGPGVSLVTAGVHIVYSFLPSVRSRRWRGTGDSGLSDLGRNAATGKLPDGTFRSHDGKSDLGGICALGTFRNGQLSRKLPFTGADDGEPLRWNDTYGYALAAAAQVGGEPADHAEPDRLPGRRCPAGRVAHARASLVGTVLVP